MDGLSELREECGVFAVWGHPDAVELTYHGLYALQHRGQESAGIVSAAPDGTWRVHRGMGLVSEVFGGRELSDLAEQGGPCALGHVRYSTTGDSSLENAQPLTLRSRGSWLALAHNGNLVDGPRWRHSLELEGAVFQTTTDTEVIGHLASREDGTWPERMARAVNRVRGGFALGVLTPEGLFAARDPHGIRPLVLGSFEGAYLLASETCAFDTVGARFVRELEPGEQIWIDDTGLRTVDAGHHLGTGLDGTLAEARPVAPSQAFCIFEFVYFARPDSVFRGRTVHEVRKELGRRLAREAPVDADVVLGVPDSSLPAATGYSEVSGIPYEHGLIKNRYVGRTFIQPRFSNRGKAVRIKLNPVREVVRGRRVVLVDDSLVRGTTSQRLVKTLRDAGATAVHLRITSPPYRHPCHYGIDTANREELIAADHPVEQIARVVGADSLHFLSVEGMLRATGLDPGSFCLGCFTGSYPVPPETTSPAALLGWGRGG